MRGIFETKNIQRMFFFFSRDSCIQQKIRIFHSWNCSTFKERFVCHDIWVLSKIVKKNEMEEII